MTYPSINLKTISVNLGPDLQCAVFILKYSPNGLQLAAGILPVVVIKYCFSILAVHFCL